VRLAEIGILHRISGTAASSAATDGCVRGPRVAVRRRRRRTPLSESEGALSTRHPPIVETTAGDDRRACGRPTGNQPTLAHKTAIHVKALPNVDDLETCVTSASPADRASRSLRYPAGPHGNRLIVLVFVLVLSLVLCPCRQRWLRLSPVVGQGFFRVAATHPRRPWPSQQHSWLLLSSAVGTSGPALATAAVAARKHRRSSSMRLASSPGLLFE